MSTTSLLSPLALTVASDRRRALQLPYSFSTSRLPHLRHGDASDSSQADLSGRIFQRRHQLAPPTRCSANQAAADEHNAAGGSVPEPEDATAKVGLWSKWKVDTSAMKSKLAKLGLAAVLAYGLFDGVTYTTFFVLAFLGYEKSTGKNPAANLQALLGIVILMWTGNNVTRPFRVAGAAALAPAVDEGLKAIQKHLKLRNQVYAFAFVVGAVAVTCLSIVGVVILSRWGK